MRRSPRPWSRGVDGVMAAQVTSAAEAEKFVTWAKFAPRGVRGVNTQGADADFTSKSPAEFTGPANRDHFTAIQIETIGALEDVDAIAAIDDVDLLFVGPSDLSQALGVLGQPDHEIVWKAIDAGRRRLPKSSARPGGSCPPARLTPTAARRWAAA